LATSPAEALTPRLKGNVASRYRNQKCFKLHAFGKPLHCGSKDVRL